MTPPRSTTAAGPVRATPRSPDAVATRAIITARKERITPHLKEGPSASRGSIAVVLAENVLEPLAQEHGLLCLLALRERFQPSELSAAVVGRLEHHIFGRGEPDRIAPLLLRGVEREVGLAHELFGTLRVPWDVRDADTHRAPLAPRQHLREGGVDVAAQPIGAQERRLHGQPRGDKCELVAADPAKRPAFALRRARQLAGRRVDRAVPSLAPMDRVELVQIVDVEEEESHLLFRPFAGLLPDRRKRPAESGSAEATILVGAQANGFYLRSSAHRPPPTVLSETYICLDDIGQGAEERPIR